MCGATATLATDLVVGPPGGLQYAVVSLRGIAAGKPFDQAPATLDPRGCEHTPHVVVVPAGQALTILNSDGALHNIHTAGLHPDMAANGGMEGSPADSDGCQTTATTGARTPWAWCLGLLATLGALLMARGARR
ncbi:MAG TPA: hypothetical protein VL049_04365 [Candidatus Dormibacteraeota bacterium]|nr:hypothetical protein [Candidatus Dormibacteraeota bacterium]